MKGFALDKEVPAADVKRLAESAERCGQPPDEIYAYQLWVNYSLFLNYGWLDLPESDEQLDDLVKTAIRVRNEYWYF